MSLLAATWTGAIASVGLLLGAVVTAMYAVRAFGEQRRLTAEQVKEIRQSLEDRMRDRWVAVTTQLGDKNPTIRLAGIHAMADLADHWGENRQICIDVLCAYLRMPYEPDPGENAAGEQRLAFQADREVRHTVIEVITAHLHPGAAASWQGRIFDFSGVVFDGGDFTDAQFSGGMVHFSYAQFCDGTVDFTRAQFSGGMVHFNLAQFSGGMVHFTVAQFPGGTVDFDRARFFPARPVLFNGAQFSGGKVDFRAASSTAAKSTSAILTTGHSRPHSPGRTHRPQVGPQDDQIHRTPQA